MPLPHLLILTSDIPLSETLQVQISDAFAVQTFSEPQVALAEARKLPPAGFIADFRMVTGGGHAAGTLLEELARLQPPPVLVVLTGIDCPEPLERHIACSGATQCREPLNIEAIVQLLLDDQAAPAPDEPAPAERDEPPVISVTSAHPEADCDFTLAGLTRRFETNTPRLRMMLSDLEVAARHDVTVLLIGETGSGKTFLSRLIHEISPRRNEPFLPIACGALPADLIESEMFGHVKGAFTSAHADKEGKFIAAGRGTILLDEIDVLGPEQQVKLLRVIESGEFEPVGSNRTLKSEARLIVASNVDLQPLVEQKRFRPDLYYRLNMLKFEILPLRSRQPDILPLARKFIAEQAAKHRVTVTRIEDSLFTSLLNYPWPGNVRELEHVIQRAVIYCREGVLSARQLPTHIVMGHAGPGNDGNTLPSSRFGDESSSRSSLGHQVALSERDIIEQTLFLNNHSRTNTAKALGISRVTLYNKMKKYGMTK